MCETLSVFAYSAGYNDAASGEQARRPESASYMDGYREGLKTPGRPCEPDPLFGLTAVPIPGTER